MTDWRADPAWSLVSYQPKYWTSTPEKPTAEAELCGNGDWASVFYNHETVATWFRLLPYKKRNR